jgi:hypothetical protein
MKENNFLYKDNSSKDIIIIIQGILTSLEESVFLEILNFEKTKDILIYNPYSGKEFSDLKKDVKSILCDLSEILEKVYLKYQKVFIIAHSSASVLVMMLKLEEKIKAISFWSPSVFYPQNFSQTLLFKENDSDVLMLDENTFVSRELAKNLDDLNTLNLVSNIEKPICIYDTNDENGEQSWVNKIDINKIPSKIKEYISVPYQHNYTKEECIELYIKTIEWFNKFS